MEFLVVFPCNTRLVDDFQTRHKLNLYHSSSYYSGVVQSEVGFMRCSMKWGPLVGARSPVLVAANTLPVLVFLLPFPFLSSDSPEDHLAQVIPPSPTSPTSCGQLAPAAGAALPVRIRRRRLDPGPALEAGKRGSRPEPPI